MADIVEAAQEEHSLSKNVKDLQAFANTVPEEVRQQYQTKLVEVVAKHAAQKAKCDELIQHLIRTDNAWPMSLEQMERDAKLHEQYDEMVQYVNELREMAGEMGKVLKELGIGKAPPPPVPPVPPEEEREKANAMDVDTDQKAPENAALSQEEYETILERLAELEASIISVENAQSQHDQDAREEWLDLIEQRLSDFKKSLANEDVTTSEEEDENTMQEDSSENLRQLQERVEKITKQSKDTSTDLADMAGILEGFQTETAGLTVQLANALQDYENAKQRQNKVSPIQQTLYSKSL